MTETSEQAPAAAKIRPGLMVPSLGQYLRAEREARGLSRERVTAVATMSAAHLAAIEKEIRVPGRQILQLLADRYDLDDAARSHLEALHAPALDFVPQQLREQVAATPALAERLADLDTVGLIAAYLDPAWNVLAANNTFRRTFPGLAEAPVGAQWFFGPVARQVLVDWDHETALLVRFLKADLARYRVAPATWRLLRQLERDDDFYRLWSADTAVAVGRDTGDLMRMRELTTGTMFSVGIQTGRWDTSISIRHFLGIRK